METNMTKPENLSNQQRRKKPRGGQKNLSMRVMEYLEAGAFERFNNEDAQKYDTDALYRRGKFNRRSARYEETPEDMGF
jgi:hypothetical protein